jgi:deazaflavin-dependent oxidoreductase (nitroreductase family)
LNAFTRAHVLLYRLSGGRLGGTFRGAPVLLLSHVGRKSGRRRTNPLLYLWDGDDLVIVASKGGSARHPAWWVNLRASPTTTVEVGREKRTVTASQASPEEKARLWPRLVEMYPDYDKYQARTARDIPVVILRRAGVA